MRNQFIFGYGSLVNRGTHAYSTVYRARLSGWRRVWRHTPLREVAFLTAEPAEGCVIDGVIVNVPHGEQELEQRERAYGRVDVSDRVQHPAGREAKVQIYTIPEGRHGPADRTHPVLLSYIDVVAQGFLREYGEPGLRHFFESTAGWDAPVRDDRHAPVYPRHQPLAPDECDLIDGMLEEVGARRI